MDDEHLIACARYVALNPVRARLTDIDHVVIMISLRKAGGLIGRDRGEYPF